MKWKILTVIQAFQIEFKEDRSCNRIYVVLQFYIKLIYIVEYSKWNFKYGI